MVGTGAIRGSKALYSAHRRWNHSRIRAAWQSGQPSHRVRTSASKCCNTSTVAMTGGQDPVGAFTLPALFSCYAPKAWQRSSSRATICTVSVRKISQRGRGPRPRQRYIAVQRETRRSARHDRPHPRPEWRGRKSPQAQAWTDRDTDVQSGDRTNGSVKGCGDCVRSPIAFPSIRSIPNSARKTAIHQSSCNLDYSCLKGDCPSFVTVTRDTHELRHTRHLWPGASFPNPKTCAVRMASRCAYSAWVAPVVVTLSRCWPPPHAGRQVRSGLGSNGFGAKGGASHF